MPCGPGPSRPGHAPRTGSPAFAFRIVRQPRGGPRPPPGTRPQRGRPVAGLARLCCENIAETGGILSADPPRAQEADKMAPCYRHSPRQSQVLQVAKPTTSPGWRRAITGRLKQIPMFAQVSSCRKHQARARDRVEQPARADRRRLPPAELTRSGPGGPGLGRPGPARRRAGKSASPSRLAPGSGIGSACRG